MECIILAGGLGTRLKTVIGDYPKCMAPVNDRPFLQYLFEYLEEQHCTRVILSLGHRHEVITEWIRPEKYSFTIDQVIEKTPLGTGGGIKLALGKAETPDVIVLNGDTFFHTDLRALLSFHVSKNAATTLALKEMHQFERYGSVNLDEHDRITSFEEKRYREHGLINGGIYVINRHQFFGKDLPERYSFEKDYLEIFVQEHLFYGYRNEGYFIDIGIPEDYERVQEDFKQLFG